MNTLSTHVLDTASGKPAAGIRIDLEQQSGSTWSQVGQGTTDKDGRAKGLVTSNAGLPAGTYRLTFHTKDYFATSGKPSFYPYAAIVFVLGSTDEHYHVPLLISGFGYSTYRGS